MKKAIAYVDGSYNSSERIYGYGVVLIIDDEITELSGSGNNAELATMHNVAGEITGAKVAVLEAIKKGCDEITIHYDYTGIECWAKGTWQCKKPATQEYKEFMLEHMKKIKIDFQKVKAHSGDKLNNRADQLAKNGAGIK